MRLIDADKLIEVLHESLEGDCDLREDYEFMGIDEFIKNQPTAYDVDNSVMLVLAEENPARYKEIVLGGTYDDGEFNDERCRTSYVDCEEKYPPDYMQEERIRYGY